MTSTRFIDKRNTSRMYCKNITRYPVQIIDIDRHWSIHGNYKIKYKTVVVTDSDHWRAVIVMVSLCWY